MGIALLGALALGGCEKGIESGTIYDKEYIPAHSSTYIYPVRSGKVTILMPHTTHYPEKFILKIEADVNGEKKVNKISVAKEIYDNKHVGEDYP